MTDTTIAVDAGTSARSIVWKQSAWLNAAATYKRLVILLSNDLAVTKTLGECVDVPDHDSFARVIVSIFNRTGRVLPLLRSFIQGELQDATPATKNSAMRGNTVTSKLEGAYVRCIAKDYIRLVLSDIVSSVAQDHDLDLEIDKQRLERQAVLEDLDSLVMSHKQMLENIVMAFIYRITDKDMVARMPREMRAIAYYIAESAKLHAPECWIPLVGGFLMLRCFAPAIVTPEVSGLLPVDANCAPKSHRNLVLVAKVLQSISNHITVLPAKERYMEPLAPFIRDTSKRMQAYLELVASDPLRQNYGDLETAPCSVTDVEVTMSDLRELFELHRLVDGCVPRLLAKYRTPGSASPREPQATTPPPSVHTPPPLTTGWVPGSRASTSATEMAKSPRASGTVMSNPRASGTVLMSPRGSGTVFVSARASGTVLQQPRAAQSGSPVSGTSPVQLAPQATQWVSSRTTRFRKELIELLENLGPPPSFSSSHHKVPLQTEELVPSSGSGDISALERARFLYQGTNSVGGAAVFYLVVNRITREFLENVNPLIAHVYRVMDAAVNSGPYILIVDMSWASITMEMKNLIYHHLDSVWKLLSRNYKKNVTQIYIIHPDTFTRALLFFMKTIVSRKLWRKVTEVYNWKALTAIMRLEDIALPEGSKSFITKSYRLAKGNAKGKRQERLIKFTLDSLLNIDPKSKQIKNEKKLSDIAEIVSEPGSSTLVLFFAGDPPAPTPVSGILPFRLQSNPVDKMRRTYYCSSPQERDAIIQDIFTCGFQKSLHTLPQEFQVVKVNKAGKAQDRTFKLTIDSVMNLDSQRHIKTEISFAGIEEVRADQTLQDVLWLKYKADAAWRKLICNQSDALLRALQDGMRQYQSGDADDTMSVDLSECDSRF